MSDAFRISAAGILRVLRSLIGAELAAGGRRLPAEEAARWPDDLSLRDDGLALDSLERMSCAAAINGFFRLHETGIEDYLLAARDLRGWAEIVAAGLAEGVSGLTLTSSGSTGTKRSSTHAVADLTTEVTHWAQVFADRRRIVACVPAHHIYGFLFSVLLPERLGVDVLDARPLPAGRLRRELAAGDLLVGFPTGYAALLRSLGDTALSPGIEAVSSTAPLPTALHHAMRALGIARVVEVYGSSETGGIAARQTAEDDFRLLPRWHAGADGDASSLREAATGHDVALPDRVAWTGVDTLRVLGRKDHAVQVGGINVYPDRVAARLREHPLVADCAVRLDAMLPEPRLKAFVVAAPGAAPGLVAAELTEWCGRTLSAPERPVRIDLGPMLPRSELGKLADWAVAA